MASKKGAQSTNVKQYERETLQAVVITDSFNVKFAPFTSDRPRALIPLLNNALLDYTLNFLASSHVDEVILFCCAFSQQIQDHVSKSPFLKEGRFIIQTIVSHRALSFGDALREIYQSGLVRSDFILVTGDVVADLKMDQVIATHKNRYKEDKSNIMTTILKEIKPHHPSRSSETNINVALDPTTGRLLSFQRPKPDQRKVKFPLSIFQDRPTVQLRDDLMETHIYICSPEVLSTFADDFDFQNLDDILRIAIDGDELRDFRIHSHIISHEYGARVGNLQSYHSVSQDMILRWTFPIVVDVLRVFGKPAKYKRNQIYQEEGVVLARGCVLEEKVVVGSHTKIGKDDDVAVYLSSTVIGRNCIIGAGVRIENSYIWDNVVIEDGCVIIGAIIGDHVRIKKNVTIDDHCLIGPKVILGPNLHVHSSSVFSQHPKQDDAQPVSKAEGYDHTVVGSEGKGYLWPIDEQSQTWGLKQQLSIQSIDDTDSLSTTTGGDSDVEIEEPVDDFTRFYEEIVELIDDRVAKVKINEIHLDNVALEISSARSAHYMSPRDTATALLKAIIASVDTSKDIKEIGAYVKSVFPKLSPIISNYVKTADDQNNAIVAIEEGCTSNDKTFPLFQTIIHVLYDADVLEEDNILTWYDSHDVSTEIKAKIHTQVQPLITWLRTASEEEDDDDDDDEDDD